MLMKNPLKYFNKRIPIMLSINKKKYSALTAHFAFPVVEVAIKLYIGGLTGLPIYNLYSYRLHMKLFYGFTISFCTYSSRLFVFDNNNMIKERERESHTIFLFNQN